MPRQPTMADIARRAGVSRVAVSYALNGRPGVSEELRERIRGIADELGFSAHGPAQVMHGAAARAVGLTMRRPVNVGVFQRELVSGIQAELMGQGLGLALQFAGSTEEEVGVYQAWVAERRVSGILVSGLETDDPRVPALERMQVPGVVIGDAVDGGRLAGIWCDEAIAVTAAVRHLVDLGHRRLARVSGPAALRQSAVRDTAFRDACESFGVKASIVVADDTADGGAQVTRRILSGVRRPTAIVYDNDVMAVAGLAVAAEMGISVPARLSIVACEDSPLCQVVSPAITVLRRDIVGYGAQATRLLLDVIAGADPRNVQAETATLVVRASTGPPS